MPKYINKRGKIRDLSLNEEKALEYGWSPYYDPKYIDEMVEQPIIGTAKEEVKIEPIGTANDEVVVTNYTETEDAKPEPTKTVKKRKPRTIKKK